MWIGSQTQMGIVGMVTKDKNSPGFQRKEPVECRVSEARHKGSFLKCGRFCFAMCGRPLLAYGSLLFHLWSVFGRSRLLNEKAKEPMAPLTVDSSFVPLFQGKSKL